MNPNPQNKSSAKKGKKHGALVKQTHTTMPYFANMVEYISDALIATDDQYRVIGWNAAAEAMYGWKAAEVSGQPLGKFIENEYIDTTLEEVIKITLKKGVWKGEVMQKRKDGTRIPVMASVSLVKDKAGRPIGFVAVNRDITEHKRAEEALRKSETRHRLLFEHMPAAVAYHQVLFENGQAVDYMYLEVNESFFKHTGLKNVVGRKVSEIVPGIHETNPELIERFGRVALTGRPEQYETYIAASKTWFFTSLYSLGNGTAVSVFDNITERKRAEEKVKQQNQRLKVLREIDLAILAADSVEKIVGAALSHVRELIDCQSANLTLIDWETNESVIFDVSTVNETLIPKGRRFPLAQYQDVIQALSQNQPLLMNDLRALADPRPAIQDLLKDGLQSLCSLPLSSQGNLIGMFSIYSEIPGYFDDEKINLAHEVANQVAIAITQSRLFENLRESELLFSKIFMDSPVAISMVGLQGGKNIEVNDAWCKLTGYSREEAIGYDTSELKIFDPEERNKLIKEFSNQGYSKLVESEITTKSRDKKNILISSEFITAKGNQLILASVVDITERKRVEEELRESEEKYRAFFQNSMDAILLTSPDGGIQAANPAACRMLGRTEIEICALGRNGLVDTRDPRLGVLLEERKKTGSAFGELTMFRNDGSPFPVEMSSVLFRDQQGNTRTTMIIRDVTERKQAVDALRESEERYRNLLETAPVGIAVHFDGRIVFTNPAGARLLGAESEEQIVGMSVLDIIHPMGLKVAQSRIQRMLAGEEGLYPVEDIYLKRDGTAVNVEVMATALNFNGKPAVQVIITDITERKRAEEKIRRQINYLTALQDIDRTIASAFDMRPSLNALISKTISLLAVDAAAVLLIDFNMNTLEFAAGDGFRTNAVKTSNVKLRESYAGRAAMERRIVKFPNPKNEKDGLFLTSFFTGEDFVSYYGVPLIVKDKVIGVLEVFQRSLIKRDQEWLDFLNALAGQAAVAISNAQLFDNLQHSNSELVQAYDATIEGWSRAMDLRDKETEGHTLRVTEMTMRLARLMYISDTELVHIHRGALLHDIGKLGVPDAILLKPGKLTDEEWVLMRQHPTHAYEMLSSVEYLKPALDIPYCHHEKWDGTGYPRGLKGDQIPLTARLFAIVDVWDALRSDRPYRAAWTVEKTREYIIKQSGKHFEPRMVEVFLKLLDESPDLQ